RLARPSKRWKDRVANMNEVDGQSKPPAASQADLAEDVVELEPTRAYPAIEPESSERSFHMALVAGSTASVTRESEILLRSRLGAAAIFLAVAYGVFFVIGLLDVHTLIGRSSIFLGVRLALCIGLAALLASPIELSLFRLRMLEYGFFGVLTVMMMVAQYVVG